MKTLNQIAQLNDRFFAAEADEAKSMAYLTAARHFFAANPTAENLNRLRECMETHRQRHAETVAIRQELADAVDEYFHTAQSDNQKS